VSLEGDILGVSCEDEILTMFKTYISFNIVKCILDVSKVKHMNSSGLSFIVRSYNTLKDVGGDLIVLNPSHHIQKLFAITKLTKICSITYTKQEGVKQLNKE
jgi:anti-sigma B factor antagonist